MSDVITYPRGTVITPNGGGISALTYAGEGFLEDLREIHGREYVRINYPRGVGHYFAEESGGAWIARVEGYPTDFGITRITLAGPSCSLFPLRGRMAPAGFAVLGFDGGYEPYAWANRGRKVGLGAWTNYRVDRPEDSAPADAPAAVLERIGNADALERVDRIAEVEARAAWADIAPDFYALDSEDFDADATFDDVYERAFTATLEARASDPVEAVDIADAVAAAVDAIRTEVGR